MSFTHLHVHSHYSLLDGLPKIPDLVKRAKELGMNALAITDHGALYGAIEFHKTCKAQGLKPIIGLEAYIAPGDLTERDIRKGKKYYHLILLAKNLVGYKNLMQLVTISHLEGYYYKPRIDKTTLSRFREGLVCLSGCLGGELAQTIAQKGEREAEKIVNEYKELFGEDYYLEIQRNTRDELQTKVNESIVNLSKKLNTPLVATNDSHYLALDDKAAQDVLVCVGTGRTVDDPNRLDMRASDLHLAGIDEMKKLFSDLPEALENTAKIAAKIDLEIPIGERHFPNFPIPKNETPATYLEKICLNGLAKRYKLDETDLEKIKQQLPKEALERLQYELKIIADKKYSAYFLIVADFVNWSRLRGIITTTRGSAAGSLTAFSLGITTMNPLEYKLPFERFLNLYRPSPPDIDIDIADNRRDEVIEYVTEKYGKDKVAQIVTFGTMMARAAVRDVGRALGIPYGKCDKIAKMIPFGKQGFHMTIDRALKLSPDLKVAYEKDQETRNLIELSKKVEGCARHASVHAAGVVIAPTKLIDYMPLQLDSDNKHVITQFEMNSVEDAGLVKMDFLGIRNLSILGRAVEIARATKDVEVNLNDLPLNDEKTFSLLSKGQTLGVFQLGSSGMTRYLTELKPTNIYDIMAMISLYRPGPMESIPEFIARKHNPEKIKYLDERMSDILDTSYGVITYQDDVLLIAINIAGYTWEEADKLRKAIGKKIPAEMAAQKEKFIQGAIDNGLSSKLAVKLWSLIEPFAAYGFNKAHAVSYAIVAYQTAYMKANYPVEFMAAVLTAESHDNKKVAAAVAECKNLGIEVLPPDVNESLGDFTVVNNNEIRFGLNAIKNLGSDVVKIIISERKQNGQFVSLADFLKRVQTRNFNKKSWEALVKSGSLDSFGERNQLLASTESILAYSRDRQRQAASGQSSLFSGSEANSEELVLAQTKPAPEKEQLAWEKELLGLYVSAHPLNHHEDKLKKLTTPINQLDISQEGQTKTIGGIITNVKMIITKKGDQMAFAEIEDLNSNLELVIFPESFVKYRSLLEVDQIVLVKGKINDKDGELKLLVDEIKDIDEDDLENFSAQGNQNLSSSPSNTIPSPVQKILKVRIPFNADPQIFNQLKRMFEKHPGNTQITLVVPDREKTPREIPTEFQVDGSENFKENLKKLLKKSLKQ